MKGKKPSESEVFDFCGPHYLTSIDWSKPEVRKSVLASLVESVYVSEGDRHKNGKEKEKLASTWWDFFQFKCIQTLTDKYDLSIFGAIFQYKPENPNSSSRSTPAQDGNANAPPKYVIAIRGTVLSLQTGARDLYLDLKIFFNLLDKSSRYELARDAVLNILNQEDAKDVWLAGHSLGAAIALQVGRSMAKRGVYLETYLFNPPHPSALFLLKHPYLEDRARLLKSFLKAGLSITLKQIHKKNSPSHEDDQDSFALLRSWIPWMFVNPTDIICREYAKYFEHRESRKSKRMAKIEEIAAKTSFVSLLSDTEASHLIPSASVMKNMIVKEDGLLAAHGLSQWWQEDLCWQSNCYMN